MLACASPQAGFLPPLPPRSADYGIDVGRNIIHGSDSVDSAMREVRTAGQELLPGLLA